MCFVHGGKLAEENWRKINGKNRVKVCLYNLLLILTLSKIFRVVLLCALDRGISSLNVVHKTFYKFQVFCMWNAVDFILNVMLVIDSLAIYLGKNYFLIIILCRVFACNPIFMFLANRHQMNYCNLEAEALVAVHFVRVYSVVSIKK